MSTLRQSESDLPKAKIRKQSRFSLVWFVPLIAAMVAAWLVFNEIWQAGPLITIQFNDGNEIVANQTILRYRGVRVGTVRSVELTRDGQHVEVRARLDRSAESLAREGSLFWIVHPEFGTGGLHGLETIVSGPYIQVEPGNGGKQTKFIGAEEPPILKTSEGGVEIILTTSNLGELTVGSPVYYRGIEVGSVWYFELGNDSTAVNVHILIETNFAPLVRADSEFWNAGGISFQLGLFSGLSMNAETVKSLLIGGIAFATPSPPGILATNGSIFPLNEKVDDNWLKWSPAIGITNTQIKPSQSPPSSFLLNSALPD
ncbi:MAG TPA: MlaD family protein [Candidatus Aquilonibacter sp.]|nr:MlaD family protein [Candidatus Aquilonibacter sp.]